MSPTTSDAAGRFGPFHDVVVVVVVVVGTGTGTIMTNQDRFDEMTGSQLYYQFGTTRSRWMLFHHPTSGKLKVTCKGVGQLVREISPL